MTPWEHPALWRELRRSGAYAYRRRAVGDLSASGNIRQRQSDQRIDTRNLRFGRLGVLGADDLRRIARRVGGPSADGDLQPCVVWRAQGQSAVCGAVGEAGAADLVEEVGEIKPGQLLLDLVG